MNTLFLYLLEHNRYMSFIGIPIMMGVAFLFSHHRRSINWPLIIKAFFLQICVGLFILKSSYGITFFSIIATGIQKMYLFADVGSSLVFGNLTNTSGPWGMIFAVKVLPVLIFFSAFISIIFHLGLIQKIVMLLHKALSPLLKTSGIELVTVIATSLLGQTEALFFVQHYIDRMTKAELFVLMTAGMSTISASLVSVYSAMGIPTTHLLASVSMSIFGSLMIAKLLFPTTEFDLQQTEESKLSLVKPTTKNILDACARGTADGLHLALMVGAMLITFLACLALINNLLLYAIFLCNMLLSFVHASWSIPELTLDTLFSYLLLPISYLLGLEGDQALAAGELLGKKIAINEFIAFSSLSLSHLHERTVILMTYALCGFSNFACIGIQLASIGVLAPEKRVWMTELGLYALLGGVLSNLITAMIANLLI